MRLALTTNARLYKNPAGDYFTKSVYDYSFFRRYLEVFETVKLIAHVEKLSEMETADMVRVNGENLVVFEVPFPHGKFDYIKKYKVINNALKGVLKDCDAVLLRIPDQLAFQVYESVKGRIPLAVEVTTHAWEFYKKGNYKNSFFRPFLRLYWDKMQRRICKRANGTAYVTKNYLQERYAPSIGEEYFTTFYTDTDIDQDWLSVPNRDYKKKEKTLIHVSTSISGTAKGHKELLVAMGELIKKGYPLKLVLVGSGDLNTANKEIVKEYSLEKCIRKTGSLTKQQILAELRNADVFVFPSYVEGLPRVVVEAMATGLACVATDLPGIRELIEAEWLVPVKNSKLLEIKLQKLLNEELSEGVGFRNREISKEYQIEKIEEKRRAFYQRLKDMVKVKNANE